MSTRCYRLLLIYDDIHNVKKKSYFTVFQIFLNVFITSTASIRLSKDVGMIRPRTQSWSTQSSRMVATLIASGPCNMTTGSENKS